ncbi:class I SAM-dependent methyltransferase [Bdellovibrio reynosensis]|uniref:Class I SAM-dependent methyltransferase n=1 Tax=Bdellovibrio reynosensis TaxID=2835041 RepID=A0ABY4CD59_9BACT|nr:class I SAM-dependent methyltransferase [Bdellovibrio reynosensis]UOF02384.1 class I SAM-dependent methyltransferase [Bdellovibrio reynosensis]
MSKEFKDLFSEKSNDYKNFRPTYPAQLFDYLAGLVHEHALAIDIGTGNGQAAMELTKHFNKVLATDPSAQQIAEASSHNKIKFEVGTAEQINAADNSADLITVAQAFHWFKHDLFFKEVQRVLKPEGILAIWVYGLCSITAEIDKPVLRLYEETLGAYWEPERRLLEENFKNIKFPFDEISSQSFLMEKNWSLDYFLGYLSTWSALKHYQKSTSHNPLTKLREELKKYWPEKEVLKIQWQIHPRLFRQR